VKSLPPSALVMAFVAKAFCALENDCAAGCSFHCCCKLGKRELAALGAATAVRSFPKKTYARVGYLLANRTDWACVSDHHRTWATSFAGDYALAMAHTRKSVYDWAADIPATDGP
jgi:hypothetical protein